MPVLFGFMALVPKREEAVSLTRLSSAIRQTLVITGTQGKALADRMSLRESHLSRQLNQQGPNLWRLLHAGVEFWRRFLPMLVEMVGLSPEDVLAMYGADTNAEREQKQLERIAELERRTAEFERQLAEVLRRLPEPATDAKQQHVA